ncbi:MAG: SRPBCC domain-containing protein [Actinomycetota bacterium]|nr:SRPBCC domain-containing protein [Actinomycetota bacterium]
MSMVPPIRREILVDADPATAFEVFTEHVGRWWPLAELSVYGDGDGATVAFAGGQIIERSADGQMAVWGTVTRWEPPDAVAFSWHPGQATESASQVEVTFAAAASQTRVTLEHSGWEAFADPAAARAEYDHGWPMVLDRYRDYAARGGDTWVALLHRAGPAAPTSGTIFEDPRFGEHIRVPQPDARGRVPGRRGPAA